MLFLFHQSNIFVTLGFKQKSMIKGIRHLPENGCRNL